jgi:hypothetical protein
LVSGASILTGMVQGFRITLAYGEGCIWPQEFIAEDLGEEDIVGDVFGFELVATGWRRRRSGVGRVSRAGRGSRRRRKRTWEASRAGGRVNGVGGRETFEIPEPVEGLNNFLGVGEDGDWVRLETGAGSLAGFELALEEESGIGEFLSLRTTITWSASPMRFMKPEIRSPERSTVLSRRIFQPSLSSLSQRRSTISVRFRESSEELSPQANEMKIAGLPSGGRSGRAAICSWFPAFRLYRAMKRLVWR